MDRERHFALNVKINNLRVIWPHFVDQLFRIDQGIIYLRPPANFFIFLILFKQNIFLLISYTFIEH